jgi:hypothetical protein
LQTNMERRGRRFENGRRPLERSLFYRAAANLMRNPLIG